jgi:hypothetical protein
MSFGHKAAGTLAAALTIGALTAPGAGAAPAPLSGNASCVGAGSSALAPGQGFGFPGQRAQVAHFGQTFGVPPGQIVRMFAHEHGTAVGCFPAGPPGS